jgi:hypothetical protein
LEEIHKKIRNKLATILENQLYRFPYVKGTAQQKDRVLLNDKPKYVFIPNHRQPDK